MIFLILITLMMLYMMFYKKKSITEHMLKDKVKDAKKALS
jgi:hypothetical protein